MELKFHAGIRTSGGRPIFIIILIAGEASNLWELVPSLLSIRRLSLA